LSSLRSGQQITVFSISTPFANIAIIKAIFNVNFLLKLLVNEMNKCFALTAGGSHKKWISPVPKGAESQKGD
jgi:hypothetical protein